MACEASNRSKNRQCSDLTVLSCFMTLFMSRCHKNLFGVPNIYYISLW